MTNIIAGITKDLKAVPKKLKEKAKSADVKKLILLNLPYVLAGYFCNKAAFLWRVAEGSNASDGSNEPNGQDVFQSVPQFFSE